MSAIKVSKRGGVKEVFDAKKIEKVLAWAVDGLEGVSVEELQAATKLMYFDGIKTSDIHNGLITAAGSVISLDKGNYTFVAARLLLQKLYKETAGGIEYPSLESYINKGVEEGVLNPQLLTFDMKRLEAEIDPKRDFLFTYLGLQTLADRYFIRTQQKAGKDNRIIEMPQHFWMRVAMGLCLNEQAREDKAIEFYHLLSKLDFVDSTPTLFNSGTKHSQLSSCYLNTVADSISADPGQNKYASIFGTIEECANLSKYAGGIGTDWTRVRPEGDPIIGTNGKSSGIVPYLKVFNDTAVAVNQGGKRNGAFAAYLEIWHADVEDFMELKKNSGEERRRTHDIFPAIWACDLFFKRVEENGMWSLFSPKEFPELHDLYGEEFEARYIEIEKEGKYRKQVPAVELWRKWITMLFETGHPWVTFKDEANRRNPQDHVGRIHCSNLCTEITLNTSDEETAVCNLGSINLSRIKDDAHLEQVVHSAIRMLDNVIDINFYPSERARNSNMRHRPIGMGVMGYYEWLVKNGIDFESEEHIKAADELFEKISYYAIKASVDLAKERGCYPSFGGSKWHRGILPIDTARTKETVLGKQAWDELRKEVVKHGVRNSNMMAIAPTATISNIAGTEPTIEPPFKRTYTKTNLSGTFMVAAPSMKYGRPELVKEAFDIDQTWVIRAAAARQKWIDQAQSINIFVKEGIKGKDLAALYMLAWKSGLKTTYYLRSQSAELKKGDKRVVGEAIPQSEETKVVDAPEQEAPAKFCTLEDIQNGCESCQ